MSVRVERPPARGAVRLSVVVPAYREGRRIEATDTTFWFRFKDDVALRVSAVPDGTSRVDMRSVSRLGRSDLGTNARRIREFLADLAR